MAAAHTNDLTHAAGCGLRTAHIARPDEKGARRGCAVGAGRIAVASLTDLADRLATCPTKATPSGKGSPAARP